MQRFSVAFFSFLVCISLMVGLPSGVMAGDVTNLTVSLHQSELVSLPREMARVVIADRGVAGVVKHRGREVSVIGHALGRTDIRFMDSNNRIIRQVNVTVTHDVPGIRRALNTLFPAEEIGVEVLNDSVALTGAVQDMQTAERAVRVVEQMLARKGDVPDLTTRVLNLLQVRGGQQVMLRVRIGELRRDAIKRLGLGAHGVITQGNAVFGALEQDQAFKVLAEPNLTAISGETAEFLAGGEIPIPVRHAGEAMSVEYKPFGVGVKFTPHVMKENRIRLVVASEVSELSDSSLYQAGMYRIPSIATRKAQTTVELAPGEAFVIAGILKDNSHTRISEIPGLANIPVLSALFRSVEYQRNETELVIAVTPYLVDPVAARDVRLPTDGFHTPGTMEMLFFGALAGKNAGSPDKAVGGAEGPAGFMLE